MKKLMMAAAVVFVGAMANGEASAAECKVKKSSDSIFEVQCGWDILGYVADWDTGWRSYCLDGSHKKTFAKYETTFEEAANYVIRQCSK